MLVQQILSVKGDDVVTVGPGTLISDAVKTLADKRIGVLVICGEGRRVDGILSERDIVRALAERGAACLHERVDDIMTRGPVCAARADDGVKVLGQMTEGRFRHMPVVEDGALVGIVTIGDLVKARLQELDMENASLQGMIMGH